MANKNDQKLLATTIAVGQLLLNKNFFRVPSYQRPFSWDEDQFSDLVDDLKTAPPNKEYFLGTIVLHEPKDEAHFDIVDGQQRLTSLLILLACLRDRIDDADHKQGIQEKILQSKNVIDGIPERVRLEVKDTATFQQYVVTPGGTLKFDEGLKLPEPQVRYIKALKIFGAEIEKLSQEDRQRLASFVSKYCVLIQLTTQTFEDAFRLFTIVNDRGKQLRRIDILKSLNIAPDVIVNSTVREKVAREWEIWENNIGESNFESVFHLWRLMVLKDKPQGDLVKEFNERVLGKTVQRGQPFVAALFKLLELYQMIFLDRDMLPEGHPDRIKFRTLIAAMDQEFRASEWRACLLAYAMKFGVDGFYQFMLRLEKQYLELWVESTRKDERSNEYAKILGAIQGAKTSAEAIESVKYDEAKILRMVQNQNLYGAGYCKFVLLRLEIVASEHDVDKVFSAKSIEHVLPQKPEAGSEWLKVHDPQKMNDYVNMVGNLVLLSKGKNSSAGNKDLEEKKAKYLKARVTDYPRSVEVLTSKEWTEKTIGSRNEDALKNFLVDP